MSKIFTFSSLDKIINNKSPKRETSGSMLKNEVYSFQLAYQYDYFARDVEIKIESPIKDFITVRQLESVPATSPNFWSGDDYVLTKEPFLCPDVLRPLDTRLPTGRYGQLNVLWFTVKGDLPVGTHEIKITLTAGIDLCCTYKLTVIDCELKNCDFTYTNWFHYDSIAQYYNVPVFSKRYNELVDNYIKCAISHGVNMLLIPMFTPPLDTRVGKERLTVQLVDVTKNDDGYSFDFDRLIAFMRRVGSFGIKYFEMSHLFTQWGAKCAPKIIARVNGRTKKIFGWESSSTSEEYEHFLASFLPQLRERLKKEGLFERCRFHLSDEPTDACFETYKQIKEIFKKYMPDGIITDALSHYEFYKDGLVECAVCATNATSKFIENNVPDLWVYYCCAQSSECLSNRFMNFPSLRNRIIGIQLYLNRIKGFLHWGYNFYNSVLSDEAVDPYLITDAGGAFQSGDGFVVYPGKEGPYDSLRHEVFYDALQDMRLLYTLEEKIGRDRVEELLLSYGYEKGFNTYPHEKSVFLKLRKQIHKLLFK